MTPTHHPSEAILTDYASGALRSAFSAVVAAHLEFCPHCRRQVSDLEALGGVMIEGLEPVAMGEARLAAAMAMLDQVEVNSPVEALAETSARIPFGRDVWLAPGMSVKKAKQGGGGDLLYLLRLPAGQKTLPHGHQGIEYTTVLKGAYDDAQKRFAAGDFCEMNPQITHQPQVMPDAECLCLIASERPMHMSTRIGRIVQALTGV